MIGRDRHAAFVLVRRVIDLPAAHFSHDRFKREAQVGLRGRLGQDAALDLARLDEDAGSHHHRDAEDAEDHQEFHQRDAGAFLEKDASRQFPVAS